MADDIQESFNSTLNGVHKFEHYLPLYEKWFSNFVGKSPKILEIGVKYGGSAELWYRYFGEGTQVYGVDIDPKASNNEYLTIIQGDQGSEFFWDENFKNLEDFDIIIDDGSHQSPHQILTLEKTFKLLKDGGIYWCEDTHTSYYLKKYKNGGLKNPKSYIEYTKNLIDVLHQEHTKTQIHRGDFDGPQIEEKFLDIFSNIQGIHYYDSIVVIEKGIPFPFVEIKHGAPYEWQN